MLTLVLLCAVITSQGAQAWFTAWTSGWETPGWGTTEQPSCRYNCGWGMGSCSCRDTCEYYGNCCWDYYTYCGTASTQEPTTAQTTPFTIDEQTPASCHYNCGWEGGSCSCRDTCEYYGNCCYDYYTYCGTTTAAQEPTTAQTTPIETPGPTPGSCRYNCGWHMGSCSCRDTCEYYGNCCYDYYSYCLPTTTTTTEATTYDPWETTAVTHYDHYSCKHNCGYHLGVCSCTSSCTWYGNCCHDFYNYCDSSTPTPPPATTEPPSCRHNCGYHMGICDCRSSCQYYGNCCNDFYDYCSFNTWPTTAWPTTAWPEATTDYPSCRHNCGYHMGSCSCSSSCEYRGNCCSDYYYYCSSTTAWPELTTDNPSCRYNCGSHMGSCSCSSSCEYRGNCCSDYYYYCSSTTTWPELTTDNPSCRYNCGSHMGSCSCSSSCEYLGNCCSDYYSYCYYTTDYYPTDNPGITGGSCGGSLSGTGSFSSPNYPGYYYDYANCVWQIRASSEQTLYLTFTYLQLENCCSCDYIEVYDGPTVGSRLLGKVCHENYNNNNHTSFHSSSNYLTVVFRTDGSVVGRGFNADFFSSLSSNLGRVDCSSDNMNIVISRSYLNSIGVDAHNLYLNDQYCRPSISYSNVVFNFPINTCGTVRKFDHGRIVYTNALRSFSSDYGEITRQSLFRLNVSCRMEQDSVSQIMYEVRHHDNVSVSGSGRYNTTMAFYTSSSFYYEVTQVPYLVSLNQNLYVQVRLRRGDSTLVLFLDTCVASPSPHDFQTRSYDLIRNGCRADSTFYTYSSGTSPYARFRFRAFQFLRATEHVYIQCKVLICPASDYNSRCRRGCSRRKARDLGSQHESETVVLGPIQLLKSEEGAEEPEKGAEEAQEETKG